MDGYMQREASPTEADALSPPGSDVRPVVLGGPFGSTPFTPAETSRMESLLATPLQKTDTATRPGPGGRSLTYIEGWRVIADANSIFGFNGWSMTLLALDVRFVDETSAHRFNACACATVRITLRDGTTREDRGGGTCTGMPSKGDAVLKAEKEAVTDAAKRALKNFGLRLGLSLYDRQHVREMNRTPAGPPRGGQNANRHHPQGNAQRGPPQGIAHRGPPQAHRPGPPPQQQMVQSKPSYTSPVTPAVARRPFSGHGPQVQGTGNRPGLPVPPSRPPNAAQQGRPALATSPPNANAKAPARQAVALPPQAFNPGQAGGSGTRPPQQGYGGGQSNSARGVRFEERAFGGGQNAPVTHGGGGGQRSGCANAQTSPSNAAGAGRGPLPAYAGGQPTSANNAGGSRAPQQGFGTGNTAPTNRNAHGPPGYGGQAGNASGAGGSRAPAQGFGAGNNAVVNENARGPPGYGAGQAGNTNVGGRSHGQASTHGAGQAGQGPNFNGGTSYGGGAVRPPPQVGAKRERDDAAAPDAQRRAEMVQREIENAKNIKFTQI